jgi:hypothetical protein
MQESRKKTKKKTPAGSFSGQGPLRKEQQATKQAAESKKSDTD